MCEKSKWQIAEEKATMKAWQTKYLPVIFDAVPVLRGAKVWLRREDGMVWWDFKDGRHEVVIDQCYHTGDWLLYVEQGYGPLHPSEWKRVKVPTPRVLVEVIKESAVQALFQRYSKVKGTLFTSDLSWPGSNASKCKSGSFF